MRIHSPPLRRKELLREWVRERHHHRDANFQTIQLKMYCSRLILWQGKIEWITYLVFPGSDSLSFLPPLFCDYTREGRIIPLWIRYDLLTSCIFKITHVLCVKLDSVFSPEPLWTEQTDSQSLSKVTKHSLQPVVARGCINRYMQFFILSTLSLLPFVINRFSHSRAFSIALFVWCSPLQGFPCGCGRRTWGKPFDASQFVEGSYGSSNREMEYLRNARGEGIGLTWLKLP